VNPVDRYGFINAKLRARIGVMHDCSFIEKMIKSPSLFEAVSVLKTTSYSFASNVYEKTGDLAQVELSLFEDEIATYEDIIKHLDPALYEFMDILLEKLEIENVKNAMRLWYSAVVRQHPISYRSGYIYKKEIVNPVDYALIINSSSFEDVKKAFVNTPYETVITGFDLNRFTKEGLFNFEMALDHLWYDTLYKAIAKLPRSDREVARRIYDVDADLKNILMIIRYGAFHNRKGSVICKFILPYGTLNEKFIKVLESAEDPVSAVNPVVRRNYPSVSGMIDELLSKKEDNPVFLAEETLKIENYLARSRRSAFVKILSGDPFTVGVLLSYFFLYKQEIGMIKAVLSAKYYKMDEQEIREELV
jgi:Archaeal/vacuolar-type H+-ATPase subunit C